VTTEQPPEHLADKETLSELKASLAASRELGPDMEEHVLEAFLTRLETRIDQRVDNEVGKKRTSRPAKQDDPTGFVAATLGTSIPLVVLAGIFGHGLGVLAVMIGVTLIILVYMAGHYGSK